MSELRKRFIETLDIKPEHVIFPENPQLFVAIGAALDENQTQISLSGIIHNLENNSSQSLVPKNTLDVLSKIKLNWMLGTPVTIKLALNTKTLPLLLGLFSLVSMQAQLLQKLSSQILKELFYSNTTAITKDNLLKMSLLS